MDRRDAAKVLWNLQTRPFNCSDDFILLDNGYVILRKEYFEKLRVSRGLVSTDEHIRVKQN